MKVIPVNVKSSVVNKVKNSSETLAKKTNKIVSRDLPNCIGAVDEIYGRKYMGIERSTFVLDENLNIIKEWRKVKVKDHVDAVIEYMNA